MLFFFHFQVKKVEEWVKAELEVESNYVNFFGIDSSQSQNDPPSSPPQHRGRGTRRTGKRWTMRMARTRTTHNDEGGDR